MTETNPTDPLVTKQSEDWFWATSREAEIWNGPESSREEAIEEAESNEESGPIWVATGTETTIDNLCGLADPDEVEQFSERLREYGDDNGLLGEDSAVVVVDAKKAAAELSDWLRRNFKLEPRWFVVDGPKEKVRE